MFTCLTPGYPPGMKPFRGWVDLKPKLPDDRLCMIDVSEGKIINLFRAGHLNESARHDMEEYVRHLTRYGWLQDERGHPHLTWGTSPTEEDQEPVRAGPLDIHMERVNEHVLPMMTCSPHITKDAFIWLVRKEFVTPEAVREYNDAVAELHPQFEKWEKKPPGLIIPEL